MELTLDMIQRTERLVAGHRCPHILPTPYALQSSSTHQLLHRAPGDLNTFSAQLFPNLHRTIALPVGVPYALDLQAQGLIALSTATTPLRVKKLGRMPAVTGRGDLQDATDRLDP